MDQPAPPPDDQVRHTQVCGGEIPALKTMTTSKKSPSKGVKKPENSASLTMRKDGSTHLKYSTKTDIDYVSSHERQWLSPVPTDFDMFGLRRSQWQRLLSRDTTVKAALTYDAEQEHQQRHSTGV